MTFKEVLQDVVSWINKEGSASYRAIKRQYAEVDDEFLEDLKDAIVFSYPITAEERGFRAKPQAPLANESSVTDATPVSAQVEGIDTAERRQITVMFCDLADSTRLAQQLDPEDFRSIIKSYQETAAKAIAKYDGYIAQLLGDGLLVYFGWPKAHEQDAERAVLTAIDLIGSIQATLNPRLRTDYAVELSVRIGIHTGQVVVGEMGGEGRSESLATGDSVNIAARLESIAGQDKIIISASTQKLVAGSIVLKSLGEKTLKGFDRGIEVFEVIRKQHGTEVAASERSGSSQFLVGRDEELGLLHRRWDQAKQGLGQVVLISGNAGIGKSGLVEAVRTDVETAGQDAMVIRCSSYHQNSPYYPLIQAFEQAIEFDPSRSDDFNRSRLTEYVEAIGLSGKHKLPYLCRLLSLDPGPDSEDLSTITPQRQKQLTSDAIVAWVFKLAQRSPSLVLWEDLHWADPSTLEVVGLMVDQIPTVPMLSILTYRPQFFPPWRQHSHITPIVLNRLELEQTKKLIAHLAGDSTLPEEVVQHIVEKTDGVPLFIEELTKMLVESDILMRTNGRFELTGSLTGLSIPDTLQDSLLARLDQLERGKAIAQLGSVIGREFSFRTIEAIHNGADEHLDAGLSELLASELLYGRGRIPEAVYVFKHALVQDAAYNTLLRTRRQKIHLSLARYFESHHKSISKGQPELIAHHYTEGEAVPEALEYWLKACNQARQKSSHSEAIAHANRGLQIVDHLEDENERAVRELNLQLALGPSLIATKGYSFGQVGKVFERARALAMRIGDSDKMYAVLWGLCSHNITRANHEESQRVGEDMNALPLSGNRAYDVVKGISLAIPAYSLSRFSESVDRFTETIQSYDQKYHAQYVAEFGMDMGVFSRGFGSHAAWHNGKYELGRRWSDESLALAEQMAHPFSKAVGTAYATMFCQFGREIEKTRKLAAATISLSAEQDFSYYLAWAMMIHGWCVGKAGAQKAGLKQIGDGLVLFRASESGRGLPYYLALQAEILNEAGYLDQSIATVELGLSEADSLNEKWWLAELIRLKADYLLQKSTDNSEHARALYNEALEVCDRQDAVSLKLRIACRLAALYRDLDLPQQGTAVLSIALNAFDKSWNTEEIAEGHRLLQQLENCG